MNDDSKDLGLIAFRSEKLRNLTNKTGVYALCDLDATPIYIGQSVDGIRSRVRRHLTSARSDVIANRQIDVWEIAYVMAWEIEDKSLITMTENGTFHHFNDISPLMNGSIPPRQSEAFSLAAANQILQVLPSDEILNRLKPEVRLPRQISQYLQLVDHYLNIKNSKELNMALDVHFARLKSYHSSFIN